MGKLSTILGGIRHLGLEVRQFLVCLQIVCASHYKERLFLKKKRCSMLYLYGLIHTRLTSWIGSMTTVCNIVCHPPPCYVCSLSGYITSFAPPPSKKSMCETFLLLTFLCTYVRSSQALRSSLLTKSWGTVPTDWQQLLEFPEQSRTSTLFVPTH